MYVKGKTGGLTQFAGFTVVKSDARRHEGTTRVVSQTERKAAEL